jgi:hypothetical protein
MFRKFMMIGMALAMTSGVASAQLANGGFESPDATGGDVGCSDSWGCFNNVFTTSAVFRSGIQGLKTFGPFAPGGGSGAVQALPAAEGDTWVGEIYAMNAALDPVDDVDFGVYKIEFLDAGGLLVDCGGGAGVPVAGCNVFESNALDASAPLDEWQLLGVGTAPAPAGTALAQAVIVKVDIDGAQGGSIFWDDASLAIDDPSPVEETSFSKIKVIFGE